MSTSLLDNIDKVNEIKKSKKGALIIKFICCYLYSQLPISSTSTSGLGSLAAYSKVY